MYTDDNYKFSAYSALFNYVDNSIFLRDKIANQVNWIHADKNGINLPIRNEPRLKQVIFTEIKSALDRRIEEYNLTIPRIKNEDIKNMEIIKPYLVTNDNEDSGYYSIFPKTFICNKCGDYRSFKNTEEWKKFDPTKCVRHGCDGHYTQISVLGFCETCGNIDSINKFCDKHGYDYLKLDQGGNKESPKDWRLYCTECEWEADFLSYSCNHKQPYSNEIIYEGKNTLFKPVDVKRGGLFKSCVKITVDIPIAPDLEFVDEIIIGNYLKCWDKYNLDESYEIDDICYYLGLLNEYPTPEDRKRAKRRKIPNESFELGESLKNDLLKIRKEYSDFTLYEITDYLILKENFPLEENKFKNISFNKSFKDYSNISQEEYIEFKENFGIEDITYISEIRLIVSSYGSIKGVNKFSESRFVPHFQPHWKGDTGIFKVYSYPFETEGIMFDLDKVKLANWVCKNCGVELEFTEEKDAKKYLFDLPENSDEFIALKH